MLQHKEFAQFLAIALPLYVGVGVAYLAGRFFTVFGNMKFAIPFMWVSSAVAMAAIIVGIFTGKLWMYMPGLFLLGFGPNAVMTRILRNREFRKRQAVGNGN